MVRKSVAAFLVDAAEEGMGCESAGYCELSNGSGFQA